MKTNLRISATVLLAGFLLAVVFLAVFHDTSRATVITVNSTEDTLSSGDGKCTLRGAIESANDDSNAADTDCASGTGDDVITFTLSPGAVISLTGGALAIENDDGTTVDGDLNDDGVPDITVADNSVGDNSGFLIESSRNRIEGLIIHGFEYSGIYVLGDGNAADNNEIINCYIGTDGTSDLGNDGHGIYLKVNGPSPPSSVNNTRIQGNLIAGNENQGIYAPDRAHGTQIVSNTIGTNLNGTSSITNSTGVFVKYARNLTITHNLLSGNKNSGLYLYTITDTLIASNTIGTNRAGTSKLANGYNGIFVVGGLTITIRDNLVSGNARHGLSLNNVQQGTITGNKIGTDVTGMSGIGNGRPGTYVRDGIMMWNSSNIVIGGPNSSDRNLVSHNGRTGIWIDNSHNNTVHNNYIGTDVLGTSDLGNGDYEVSGSAGIYIKDGSSANTIQDNLVRYNYVGVWLSGDPEELWLPPMGNDVLTNTITSNDQYGIGSKATHSNTTPYTTPSDGDNLFQGNKIIDTAGAGIGVYNYGASPRMIGNTIESNDGDGVMNLVYFGANSASDYADDLLSVPLIASNVISANEEGGITSRDTAPLNKETLLGDNTFFNNNGLPHIAQRWLGAVEVISDSTAITSAMAVTITRFGGEPPDTCRHGDCRGTIFSPASGGDGIWVGSDADAYDQVEVVLAGKVTYKWFEIVEYEVRWTGEWITYTPHLVQAGGAHLGVRAFEFDGITTTAEITRDTNLPTCVNTGILSDADHTLCRYQIVQLDVLTADDDWDNDGITNDQEGNDDTDGDGLPDPYDDDDDNDGILTEDECPDGWPCPDTDGDGIPDPYDNDDDGDGILTEHECTEGGPPELCPDTDGDDIPDPYDKDDDGDGVDTEFENPDPNNDGNPDDAEDTDEDGTPDYKDPDDDGDGIPTLQEDSDPDGNGDPADAADSDGDGDPDYKDTDSNNNGISDMDESGLDVNDDGVVGADDCLALYAPALCGDDDDDDVLDWLDPDYNDTDGDGIPDPLDTDADGDGTSDTCEETPPDVHAPDKDCDNIPDWQDTDNDNDGITDHEELDAGTPANPECPDGVPGTHGSAANDEDDDGAPDCLEEDLDDNGVPDYMENDGGCSVGDLYPDADCDGIPNHLDTDSDGDGKSDDYEYDEVCGALPPPCNTDKIGPPDNIPDFLDPVFDAFLPIILRSY
jgi:CSLREA domain-containing protein